MTVTLDAKAGEKKRRGVETAQKEKVKPPSRTRPGKQRGGLRQRFGGFRVGLYGTLRL